MERKILTDDQLHQIALFSSLPKEKRHELLKCNRVQCVSYGLGEFVHMESDPCLAIEIVLEGHLSVEQIGEDGDIFSVATFGSGSLIGGNVVFSSLPFYAHSIISIERSLLVRIDRDTLFELIVAYKVFLKHFLTVISDNTVMVNNRLSYLMQYSLRQRLFIYIQSEMVRQQQETIILPITKTRLAQLLGVSRTSISRELAKMRNEGLLKLNKRKITLLDTDMSNNVKGT
ncbi:Crp/Fnr family transcriptional regulator [Pleomorphochaeta sp. DL1XJH-081]|uniref:Crp/Fnr family transcriptional regulator n=1 Tax=Pleomorphochaeta sp. DL1XJH-081 TaxID=3409690 RepID=UPI003BB7AD57